MNKQWLLAFARGKGYKGKAELADIKTWLKDELGYDPDKLSIGGKEHKVDDIWAKAAAIECPEPAPEPEPTPEPAPVPETKSRPQQTGNGFRAGPGKVDAAKTLHSPETFRIRAEKAAYKRRIVAGKAAFDDPDLAERAGAWLRLSQAKALRIEDYPQKSADIEILKKDSSEGINTLGGATVPDEFIPAIIFLTEKFGCARRITNVVRMGRDTAIFPRCTTPLAMSATAEAGTMTATDPAWDNVSLTAKKWSVLIKSSTELLEDTAINIADFIASQVARAQARSEDLVYFLGDGTITYNHDVGLNNGLIPGAYDNASSNTWGSMVEADLLGLVGEVENVDIGGCAFVCSRQFFWQVPMRLAQAKGGQSAAMTFLYGTERGAAGEDALLYGFPCYFQQVAGLIAGSAQDVMYFGDFKNATMLGDRRDMRIDYSDQRYFDTDQVAWRGTSRFTVNIHGDGQSGSTVGPIAALHTTA